MRIQGIAANRVSGAAGLLDEAIAILRTALARDVAISPLARAVCRAQPSMAPLWNASVEALASRQDRERFERFASRVARSSSALARFARDHFPAAGRSTPLHLVTLSASRSVQTALTTIREQQPLRVSCSESRPALEGRRLATSLADTAVSVICYADAAIAQALADADAVLFGADAVGPHAFLNKSGTRMLAAAANLQGVPVYVMATRDKFASPALWDRLTIRQGAPGEIWESPPPGVDIRNAYFEPTPLDLVTAVISDAGVLGGDMVPSLCASLADPPALDALAELIA